MKCRDMINQRMDDFAKSSEDHFRPWRLTNRNEIWKWTDLILENKTSGKTASKDIPNFKDGYSVQKVIDAVIQSAERKREVLVEEILKAEQRR